MVYPSVICQGLEGTRRRAVLWIYSGMVPLSPDASSSERQLQQQICGGIHHCKGPSTLQSWSLEKSRTWKSTYPVLLSPSLTHAPPIFSDHGEDAPFHFFGMNFMRGSSSAFLSVKYPPRIRPFLSISHTHTKRNSITESLNPIGFPLPRIFQG